MIEVMLLRVIQTTDELTSWDMLILKENSTLINWSNHSNHGKEGKENPINKL